MKSIYLDHSATTPVDKRVADVVRDCMLDNFGNPSSIHSFGREARDVKENARKIIADMINSSPEEIYFTSGGTEADNLALLGYVRKYDDRGKHIIVSSIEHPAVLRTAMELDEELGFNVTYVEPDEFGTIHPGAIAEAITDGTILISIMHVNNEVGTINDVVAIGKIAREKGIAFHTDAVQSFGKIPIDVEAMNIDMLSLSSHKIYGPKGVGAIYIRKGIELQTRVFGGKQESGVRSGTENLPGIVGMGLAAQISGEIIDQEARDIGNLRDELSRLILDQLSNVKLNGHPTNRLPGNLSLTFYGVEGEALLLTLDLQGIGVSTGSACSSGKSDASHVLTAIGLSDEDANSTIRFTLGRSNNLEDIQQTAEIIINTVNRLRSMSGD
ncbi:MAG: cysteine desulfurase [Calditrichaeota bacterium]|nr:cysteine desulfurase [Calditrichota bacterium]MBT7617521.1 cysteine desulfurase [Calditrichota bacterium]MBT7787844.1 cysteine desulfurase [Calditrichota bacterium]